MYIPLSYSADTKENGSLQVQQVLSPEAMIQLMKEHDPILFAGQIRQLEIGLGLIQEDVERHFREQMSAIEGQELMLSQGDGDW